MTLIAAALGFGHPVFACLANKRPLTPNGFKDATSLPDEISRQFSQSGAALIGMPTGEVSGLDALDIDPRNGGGTWEEANLHRLPETRVHQTPSGGRHYLFIHAPGVRNSAGLVGRGVDVRGTGGYICVPNSPNYSVISDADPCHWPDWLLELVLKQPRPAERPTPSPREPISSRRIEGFVATTLTKVRTAQDGQKHFTLRNAALSLGGIQHTAGFSTNEAVQWLLDALPPIHDLENARKTARWGIENGAREPIDLPDREQYRANGQHHPVAAPPDDETDPAFWESLERSLEEDTDQNTADPPPEPTKPIDRRPSTVIDPRKWTAPAPLREWILDGWIPRGYVTGLYGDGATGKSLISQQLLTCVSLGRPWLGIPTKIGRSFGFMCEDDENELHRRQESINHSLHISMESLENLRFASRVGADNLLMTFDERNRGYPTELMHKLGQFLEKFRPDLVVLDTLADIFGGDEIKRAQARLFIQGIGGNIARTFNCGVVIAAHPSQSGLNSGSGTGGSTAWNNTFRSRMYLQKKEGDPDARTLSRMKANYGSTDGALTLKWSSGVFVVQEPTEHPSSALSWQDIQSIFNEIERRWNAKRPFSLAAQTKKDGRYLPLWAASNLGAKERDVLRAAERWLTTGHLGAVLVDTHSKMTGLKIIRRPDDEFSASQELEDTPF